MLQLAHKMGNLNQNEICAVLCSKKAIQKKCWRKWLCKILRIAGLLNTENPIKIQNQTFINIIAGEGEGNQPP